MNIEITEKANIVVEEFEQELCLIETSGGLLFAVEIDYVERCLEAGNIFSPYDGRLCLWNDDDVEEETTLTTADVCEHFAELDPKYLVQLHNKEIETQLRYVGNGLFSVDNERHGLFEVK